MDSLSRNHLILLLFVPIVALSGCGGGAEIGYRPPIIPIRVSIDPINGKVKLGPHFKDWTTPLGTFDLELERSYDFEYLLINLTGDDAVKDKRLLIVRVDNEMTVFELTKGEEFRVEFQGEESGYKKVGLIYENDGDIILELESVGSLVAVNAPLPTQRMPTLSPQQFTPTPKGISCSEPQGIFRNLWAKYKDQLGCPSRTDPLNGLFAEQPFQNGHMFWSKNAQLYLIAIGKSHGTWLLYGEDESPWKEGMPDVACSAEVIRGFGGLWCNNLHIQEQLGRPTDEERGFDNGVDLIQGFDEGIIFRDSDGNTRGLAYVLFNDGSFVREPY